MPEAAMNPYYRRKLMTYAERKQGMRDFVEALENRYGPRV